MKRLSIVTLLLMLPAGLSAQNTVQGIVQSKSSNHFLSGVSVSVENTKIKELTSKQGHFVLENIPNGKYNLLLEKEGYESKNYPITLQDESLDLGVVLMFESFLEEHDLSTLIITDDELNDDFEVVDNISGLLQASKDTYLQTAAFDFSGAFYKLRGLGSENSVVMLNGVEMNKLFDGRPQWSNWGGLNDVMRHQEFSRFLSPSNYSFGGLLGVTYMNTRPSLQYPGFRVSYASSNRSYVHRAMATYSTGLLSSGWAITLSGSRREGNEGFVNGTSYNAYAVFMGIEKKINAKHSVGLTGVFAPNRRGKSSSNTQEVYDLKGTQYNAYWGYQDGEIRNSRLKEIVEPIGILNHYWTMSKRIMLQTNIGFQYGKTGNSRLEFNGTNLNLGDIPEGRGLNPDPTYFQKLPSYALRNFPESPEVAYGLQQEFLNDGQLNWEQLYQTNIDSKRRGENAINVLYEDSVDDRQLSANSILNATLNENLRITGSLSYKNLRSENYAQVLDLLGGTGYLDVDSFADDLKNNPNAVQNNVLNPNRIVVEGDTFKYNYRILSSVFSGFAQAQFQYHKLDFYMAATATKTRYEREGLYKNGGFLNSSLGKGEAIDFTGLGAKVGGIYKITGRHLLEANAAYSRKAPTIRNTFVNARENHAIVPHITEEKVMSTDATYSLRLPKIKAKLSGFYTAFKDANTVSFFYTDGINGDERAFVQEILQGVNKTYFGGEFAIETKVTPTITLKGVAAVGQYTFDNNPNLYLASESFVDSNSNDELIQNFGMRDYGKASMKNYRIASGPQRAFSLGFQYRDPDYWWVGATSNMLSHAYINISPIQRSRNFYTDIDGLPFNDYDETLAKELLTQEQFNASMVVNMVGGKSWKIKERYISVFASVNNLFNERYKTGGFENGRNANFRQLRADKALDTPVFGAKYWYSRGTTYFLNINFRF